MTKTNAGQKTFNGGKPLKPQLSQPAKQIRRRQCSQSAEFRDDAQPNRQRTQVKPTDSLHAAANLQARRTNPNPPGLRPPNFELSTDSSAT
ncbi:hypothetical protein [Methylovulum miyakonense]|uniref:hypothetical protein n=1 Tax=Methylovulum miyakonense TaxID=645578 RepID=UPI0003A99750|nr:hypothetical protein [Methylovulum miyakonense]